jgi:hypothetical protein
MTPGCSVVSTSVTLERSRYPKSCTRRGPAAERNEFRSTSVARYVNISILLILRATRPHGRVRAFLEGQVLAVGVQSRGNVSVGQNKSRRRRQHRDFNKFNKIFEGAPAACEVSSGQRVAFRLSRRVGDQMLRFVEISTRELPAWQSGLAAVALAKGRRTRDNHS